jgi:hypothetical protein
MNSADITLSVFIIIIFILLYIFNILAVGIKNIEDNWPQYRCNPVVMPFSSVFGHDTTSNFTFCIQTMMQNYMGYLMHPLFYNFNILGNISKTVKGGLNSAKAFFYYIRDSIADVIHGVFSAFLNILIEFQRVTISLKDIFSKLIGIMVTIIYTVEGSLHTMNSTWEGPPGQLVKALCFHPDTKIELKDGSLVAMKDVPLNAVLKTGSKVSAVMNISNLDEKGDFIEKLYSIEGGENDEIILVSGSHLVHDPEIKKFIQVKELSVDKAKISPVHSATFSCLITSDHIIPIGKWIFHDWEDNNGSISKKL